ncbi:MAG: hypothetical protein IT456_13800 [Planctomycetes bacterium]|nr:hypothetical protein [Planctomycetota bacterium]
MRPSPALLLASLTFAALAHAQTPQVTFTGDTMRMRSATVTATGGTAFNVSLTMEDDNANAALGTSFRRWWHCQIGNLAAAGNTLTVTVGNAGYTDVILPVWAQSTDGGVTFGPYTRLPLSAVPTQPSSTQHRFTIATPPGTTTIRIAKYFPYTTARKDAYVASLATHARVRSVAVIGTSVQGRPIHRIELTDSTVPDAGKKRIWIHSGIHPAETTSYFTVEGLIDWLGSGDPYAEVLLDHTILDIVPMANPDGVALGNYRTNANSSNLENEWAAPYNSAQPEITALRTAIEGYMGTPAAPASNPIVVVLNLHSSHNVSYPFHFQHTANANWNATSNNSGVLPVVNQLEGQWISTFRANSLFVQRGSTQSSSAGAPSRPFVESMMHDRWSALSSWTGAPAFQQPVMAITFEGTYGMGPQQTSWNTESDYNLCGAQLGKSLALYLGLQPTSSVVSYGSPCSTLVLTAQLAPSGGGQQASLNFAGAPANALGFAMFGLQSAASPLPAPWSNCLLRQSLDSNLLVFANGLGIGQYSVFVPPWAGLSVFSQVLTLDPAQANFGLDTSNGVELRNNY